MEKYNTVLILGAGASKPYGFPVGEELLEQIKISLRQEQEFHTYLLNKGYLVDKIKRLLQLLGETQVDTIDEFLGVPVCKNNATYTRIIKYAIAYALLKKENSTRLEGTNDWYKKLYVKIFGLMEDNFTNDTAIITFNYDRSLEEFLCRAHAAKQGIHIENAKKSLLIKQIPIVHVHGKLSSEGYGGSSDFKTVMKASGGIIVNTDKTTRSSYDRGLKKANALILKANSIYILGFGYHDENIKKIGLDKLVRKNIIKGTALNMTSPRCNHIRETISGIGLIPSNIKQFLADEWM